MIRRSCVLLAAVGLFLQGSQGGHMLLVEHTRCAEHGDLVHGEGHDHGVGDAATAEHRALEAAANLGDEEAHGHCSHASERRDAAADVPTSHALALRRDEPIPSLREASAFPTLAQLYRTAPKNSPPA